MDGFRVEVAARAADGALPDGISMDGQGSARPASASGKNLSPLQACHSCSEPEHERSSALRPEYTEAPRFAFRLCAIPAESPGADQALIASGLAWDVQD